MSNGAPLPDDYCADVRLALIAEIEAAFDGVKREDGVTLHEARVIDDYGSDEERAAARLKDTKTRWQDVPEADIEEFYEAFSFVDAKGFHYYAPAFMVWTLRHYRSSDSLSSDATIYAFDQGALKQDGRYERFRPPQRAAVCRFLRYFVEHDDDYADREAAVRALKKGWWQYCCDPEKGMPWRSGARR